MPVSPAALRAEAARCPDDYAAQLAIARRMTAAGMPRDATAALRRAVMLAPDDPECVLAYAAALSSADEREAAINVLKDAVRLRPGEVRLTVALAEAQEAVGHDSAAAAAYLAAVDLEPHVPRWAVRRAGCLERGGESRAALTAYAAAYRTAPDAFAADDLARFGDAALKAADPAAAAIAYDALARRSPDPVRQVEVLRGVAAIKAGDVERGRAILEAAADRWPHDPDTAAALRLADALAPDPMPLITPAGYAVPADRHWVSPASARFLPPVRRGWHAAER